MINTSNLKKINKADMVYKFIRERIMDGDWKPGDRLYDDELADKLGTSRNSVRQALSNLVENHLVEKGHWKGYKVRTPAWEEIAEAIDIRKCLELFVYNKLEQLSKNDFDKIISELTELLNTIKEMLTNESRISPSIDKEFHLIIYRAVSPYLLIDLMEGLLAITDLQLNSHFKLFPEGFKISYKEHLAILRFLKKRDFINAKSLLEEHIERYRERSYDAYTNLIQNDNYDNNDDK